MKITDHFVFFYGKEDVFSNWFPCKFKIEDYVFQNSEQAMMFAKAQFFDDPRLAYQILDTPDPRLAKALGRKVHNFDEAVWTQVSLELVADIQYYKFKSTQELTDIILATEDRTLVEASPTDCIWGIGLSIRNPDIMNILKWQGTNRLGKALMIARNRIQEELEY